MQITEQRQRHSTYPVVLIGRDGGEPGFREDKGLEVFRACGVRHLGFGRDVQHVEPGLVPVH